jgi:hypothetical protein
MLLNVNTLAVILNYIKDKALNVTKYIKIYFIL